MSGYINTLVKSILHGYDGNRFIVAVDGLSRAGKTTIVAELRKKLMENDRTVYVFHIDDHIVERKRRYNTGFEEWQEYYDLQWDVVELRRELFEKLRHTPDINVPFYNSEQDETANRTVVIPHDCIVIVEGVFLQRQEWRQFLDFVVYLDCPRATRFQRESTSTREQIEKFQRRYWKAEDHYLATVNPLSSADMVINS